jgi:hypothetical protein
MLEIPDADNAARVADFVELELSLGEPSFSKAKLTAILRDASGIEPAESFISDVWRHLRRRIARHSADLFEIHGDILTRSDAVNDGRLEYETCLFFSLYGASSQGGAEPKLFERMTADAVANYLDGRAFIFGWPVLPDTEAEIAARVRSVAIEMGERFVEGPGARYKDRGVDIIGWKPFEEPDETDNRTGQLVMLTQCAAGQDWRDKTGELPMASWTQYIHWASDPIAGFAVPCVIEDDLWHDIHREVEGVVFDRIRIVNLLGSGVRLVELRDALRTWVDEQKDEHSV